MRILGIDPGLANTGYGVIEHDGKRSRMLTSGTVITQSDWPVARRLQQIHDEIALVIDKYKPEVASLEQLYFSTNVRTAMAVAQGRGVAILATAKANIPMVEYTPQQIKQAVSGSGKAAKNQVERMVKVLLGLEEIPATNHAADALAVALCHAHSHRFREMVVTSLQKNSGGRQRPALDLGTARFLRRK